jgi:hypothetical protein
MSEEQYKLLQVKTFKDQENHTYGETPKIFHFYSSKFPLAKRLFQSFI